MDTLCPNKTLYEHYYLNFICFEGSWNALLLSIFFQPLKNVIKKKRKKSSCHKKKKGFLDPDLYMERHTMVWRTLIPKKKMLGLLAGKSRGSMTTMPTQQARQRRGLPPSAAGRQASLLISTMAPCPGLSSGLLVTCPAPRWPWRLALNLIKC